MKKDRNTFFAESSYMNQATFPNMPMQNNQQFMTNSYGAQGFYAGPSMGQQNFNQNDYQNNSYNDLESRLSKIERQLNRMDARISKLENTNFYSTDDVDNTNNIYMV